eukprot:CAMPEP_0194039504 /NCGR_PEP_ID=MMETSP0009_2-20130614/11621_1 /TAXON_ID=210454 /ORGANISM="Grammatophora oceanica, Strain CCMP 410" /LENGTH=285 /DNA_ID=CAMNT_0038682363 /DNA_START=111 /DNA_END=968 /DNA_ORIENTATION=+
MQSVRAAAASPMVPQSYKLLQKTKLSHDSYLLRYEIQGRKLLGLAPAIPTCIKVDYPGGVNEKTGQPKVLSKSYSPVSHPNTEGTFDLIVKAYPNRPGGGVGKYICDMKEGDSIRATLKKQRIMHGSALVEQRWKHVGLVAGGTGIAPLLQIARILLESNGETKIHLLFINHTEDDILCRAMIDSLAKQHANQFTVHYSVTNQQDAPTNFLQGRGDVSMVQKALPKPTDPNVMVFVCGRDGFVAHWAGPVARAPSENGKKGPKIQGPLLGVLADSGFSADQVFKY